MRCEQLFDVQERIGEGERIIGQKVEVGRIGLEIKFGTAILTLWEIIYCCEVFRR